MKTKFFDCTSILISKRWHLGFHVMQMFFFGCVQYIIHMPLQASEYPGHSWYPHTDQEAGGTHQDQVSWRRPHEGVWYSESSKWGTSGEQPGMNWFLAYWGLLWSFKLVCDKFFLAHCNSFQLSNLKFRLFQVFARIGANKKLGLTGRPNRPIGALGTSKIYKIMGQLVVFYPTDSMTDFYTVFDVKIIIHQIKVCSCMYSGHALL